jgi:hypothetical protein
MLRPSLLLPTSLLVAGLLAVSAAAASVSAETCTTQSQMKPADRDILAQAAANLATRIQANDASAVRTSTIADFRDNFAGMASTIASIAPKLAAAEPQVEQLYLLDASSLSKTAAGANPDAQFFCSLNQTENAAEFAIPQLPPGRYAFAMVRMQNANPWRLSLLLRFDNNQWLLAGLYPKPLTAAGHDGLWYWKQARALSGSASAPAASKEPWNAWLLYQEAQSLLQPTGFLSSTHLDKLDSETSAAAPPAVSAGLSPDAPLVLKAADGTEFRFTSLGVDDSLSNDKVDVAAHYKVDSLGDGTTARKANVDAITALVAAHPELRRAFHGVHIFADAPNQSPYATELAMSEIK